MAFGSRGADRGRVFLRRGGRLSLLLAVLVLASCGGGGVDGNVAVEATTFRRTDSATAASAFLGQSLFDGKPASIGVTELTKVAERRVSRTVWEYDFRAGVLNAGGDARGVTLSLNQVPDGTTVVGGVIAVGDLAGGASATPTQTITLRTDRLVAFDPGRFVWTLAVADGVVASASATIAPGGTASLDTMLTADFQGQSGLNGTRADLKRLRSQSADEALGQDGATYGILARPDDTFEIQIDKVPATPGLKVTLLVPGYSASELDQLRVPVVMARRLLAGGDDDGGDAFVTLESDLDPATLRITALVPPSLFALQPGGRFSAFVRVAVVQGSAPVTAQRAGTKQAQRAGTAEPAAITIGAGTPVRCPVAHPEGCIEVSMYGNRVETGSANQAGTLHMGIDLRGNGNDVLGVAGAKVVAFRTVEDANAGFGGGTGAIVILQLGRVTYKYMHLGSIRKEILDCKADFKANGSRLYQVGTKPCAFVPGPASLVIGTVGGTGAGKGKPHLHFEILDVVGRTCAYIESEKVQRCWSTVAAADPFPYLLSKLSLASPAPASVSTGASLNIGVKGEDVAGTAVRSEIGDSGSPVGNQRYLCATEGGNGRYLDFAGGPYGLVRRAPGPTSGTLEHTSVANLGWNTKCRLWSATTPVDGFFSLKAATVGNAVLDFYYTDQNVEKTPLQSRPFASASLSIGGSSYRGNVSVSGPAAITGSSCTGTMTVSGEVVANLSGSAVLTFNGNEIFALSCYGQTIPASTSIPLTVNGTHVTGTVVSPFTCGAPCVSGKSTWTVDLQIVTVGGVRSLQGTLDHINENQTPFYARATGTITVPQAP